MTHDQEHAVREAMRPLFFSFHSNPGLMARRLQRTPEPWSMERPQDGGRILAKDARRTVIHTPPCSPENEQARADAQLFYASPQIYAALVRMVAEADALAESDEAQSGRLAGLFAAADAARDALSDAEAWA